MSKVDETNPPTPILTSLNSLAMARTVESVTEIEQEKRMEPRYSLLDFRFPALCGGLQATGKGTGEP